MSDDTKTTEPDAPEAPKKSKKKLFIAVGLVVLLGGVAYMFVGRGGGGDADATAGTGDTVAVEAPAALEFSEIVDLPAININLADGHYLRVAVSLGLHAPEEEPVEGEVEAEPAAEATDEPSIPIAPAADLVVAIFSGRTMDSLATPEGRQEAKALLTAQIVEHYGEIVASVFLTEFVMQ